MKTILNFKQLGDLGDDKAVLIDLVEGELQRCERVQDQLGAGEWLVSRVMLPAKLSAEELDRSFIRLVVVWSSSVPVASPPRSADELIHRLDEFDREQLAISVARTILLFQSGSAIPPSAEKIAYKLQPQLRNLAGVSEGGPKAVMVAAARKVGEALHDFDLAVAAFTSSDYQTLSAAKDASHRVLRKVSELKRFLLAGERPLQDEIRDLLGGAFRAFCDACLRQEKATILELAPTVREQASHAIRTEKDSTFWMTTAYLIGQHIVSLTDTAVEKNKEATNPVLALANTFVKVDLSGMTPESSFYCRLVNKGEGLAREVRLALPERLPVDVMLVHPSLPFDIPPGADQILKFTVKPTNPIASVCVPMSCNCRTVLRADYKIRLELQVEQQSSQPDWAALEQEPPYSINPIRQAEKLFGRNRVLSELVLHAGQRKSTFLWGQKRIGKTSLLQVLVDQLRKRENYACAFLRMGELRALHEGQIAHTIGKRLAVEAALDPQMVPSEGELGAGLGRLVPVIERWLRTGPRLKLVCAIDEFDDFDPAFYTGERGKQFVLALRSLSEEGLTFFFAGSERMNAIHERHQMELNKWANVFLDRIEAREDCKDLVERPVAGRIEYQRECTDAIIEYSGHNPFYMHLLCAKILSTVCMQERRTFVSETDLPFVKERLQTEIAAANFAHFWQDNPELDPGERARQTAENCLILACVSHRRQDFTTLEDLLAVQEQQELGPTEQLGPERIRSTVARLLNRRVLSQSTSRRSLGIALPIFRDWLVLHGERHLLSIWREHCREVGPVSQAALPITSVLVDASFPISEDDLLAVSQNLVYLGKQKDVAEVRQWLLQFDDDTRIELAFRLLGRLAESGYVSQGADTNALATLGEMVESNRAKREVVWKRIGGRTDNLCLAYVDNEEKSGAEVARELAKRLRPGKRGPLEDVKDWVHRHTDGDSLLIVVDDFSGTGTTIAKGLEKFVLRASTSPAIAQFLKEGWVACYLLYAFPEGLETLQNRFPTISFNAVHVFGEDVRSLHPEAKLFENETERLFARDMLLQIGRELYPANPLGYGDMGGLVCFHDTIPNNSLPIFWCDGTVGEKQWRALFPRLGGRV
jgi:hypothetical protein